MTRRLDLCADDFGLTPGLSQVVAALAGRGRVSSLSCLVNTPHWAACAPLLAPLAGRVGLGLHFNLTEGAPRSAALARRWPRLPALPRLIAGAQLRRLPLADIAAEWQAQLDAFIEATGRPPDHVDGHQHVHHLPGVRDVVLAGVAALAPMPGVRNTGRVLGPGFAIKRRLIEATGGRTLARLLARRGLPHSAALLGAYDFEAADYGALIRGWLGEAPAQGALLFSHPGPHEPGDPIGAARAREHAYLAGDVFARDLGAAGVELGADWIR
jgi:chitin disaccharide deacetylase